MIGRAAATIQRLLRIPPPPAPPVGAAGSSRVFQAAVGFYRLRLCQWGLGQAGTLAGIGFGLTFGFFLPEKLDELIGGYIRMAELVALALFAFQLGLTLVLRTMDYRLRWYLVTDRSLRIREGIFRIREQTVSFANIQNVAVRQGPLQRWLGIADLEIRTAGGGEKTDAAGKGENLHRAVFRGVDNAPEIRDLIRRDLQRLRQAEAAEVDAPSPLLAAARELAAAARELRAAAADRSPAAAARL
jgi:hypothetical protein